MRPADDPRGGRGVEATRFVAAPRTTLKEPSNCAVSIEPAGHAPSAQLSPEKPSTHVHFPVPVKPSSQEPLDRPLPRTPHVSVTRGALRSSSPPSGQRSHVSPK